MFSSSVDAPRPDVDEIRNRRVELARRNAAWVEIEESALVSRGRLLIHADSDAVYKPYRGVVFATGSTTVIADYTPLHFYVRDNGELTFLELEQGTWSDRVARRAQLQVRRTTPRRPMRRGGA